MLINEKGLVRNIKRAFKGEGYTVQNLGDRICVYGGDWYVQGLRALFPRKALAAIVEHVGEIPEKGTAVFIIKDGEAQMILPDVAEDDNEHWLCGDRGREVTITPVIMQGYQVFQPDGGGACWGIPMHLLETVERDVAEHTGAEVLGEDRLMWEGDGEVVVIDGVRKACSGWAKEWERVCWGALESVNLHKEENA